MRKSSALVVAAAVVILLFIAVGYTQFGGQKQTEALEDKSIAILPFKNLSDDPRNEYFGDGVMEAICTARPLNRSLEISQRAMKFHVG